MWRKGNSSSVLMEMQIGAANMENSKEFLQKTKNWTETGLGPGTLNYSAAVLAPGQIYTQVTKYKEI